MKGIVIYKEGKNYIRKLKSNLDTPTLENDEVLVETYYGGLNYADLMMCRGTYPHPKGYPLIAGLELSGKIIKCGKEVKDLSPGDNVVGFSEEAGAFTELCKLKRNAVTILDKEILLSDAAAFFVQTTTAYHLLYTVAKIKPNQKILIHAIGGGVGLNLIQLAKLKDAIVIGTVGTSGKEKKAYECGADLVIDRTKSNFVNEIQDKYGNRPIDVLIDSTGAGILESSFALMKNLSHVVSYGEASGKPYDNLWERLVEKSLTFTRLHIGHMDFKSDYWIDAQKNIQKLIKNKQLKIFVEKIYNIDEFNEMYESLDTRKISGKLLIKFK